MPETRTGKGPTKGVAGSAYTEAKVRHEVELEVQTDSFWGSREQIGVADSKLVVGGGNFLVGDRKFDTSSGDAGTPSANAAAQSAVFDTSSRGFGTFYGNVGT